MFINGLSRVSSLVSGVISHLLTGMNRQVWKIRVVNLLYNLVIVPHLNLALVSWRVPYSLISTS